MDFDAHLSLHPDPNYNGVRNQYETCIEQGFVKTPRPLQDFFDISVYADALKAVIEENPDEQFYKNMWKYFVAHNDHYSDFDKKYPREL